jgi:hypothetical protein
LPDATRLLLLLPEYPAAFADTSRLLLLLPTGLEAVSVFLGEAFPTRLLLLLPKGLAAVDVVLLGEELADTTDLAGGLEALADATDVLVPQLCTRRCSWYWE